MSNFKGKEPSMKEPQPVPGEVPDFPPPPYSSSPGSESEAYSLVPPPPTNSPYPKQIPTTQDTTVYNPMSQVTIDDGKSFPQTGPDTTYAPATRDPVEDMPLVNLESTSNQTDLDPAGSADSARERKGCYRRLCYTIIGIALIAAGLCLRVYTKIQLKNLS